MRVKLIKESSGWGYGAVAAAFMVESPENFGLFSDLKKGKAVDIPSGVAKSLHNIVSVETGAVISKKAMVRLSPEEVKAKYQEAPKKKEIRNKLKDMNVKKDSSPKLKPKITQPKEGEQDAKSEESEFQTDKG